jgi:hypothetical protein
MQYDTPQKRITQGYFGVLVNQNSPKQSTSQPKKLPMHSKSKHYIESGNIPSISGTEIFMKFFIVKHHHRVPPHIQLISMALRRSGRTDCCCQQNISGKTAKQEFTKHEI